MVQSPWINGLPDGDHDQEPPEVVAIGQPRESPRGGAAAEAVEGAQGRILLILDRPGPPRGAESGAGEMDQAIEVALPEVLGGGVAAGLQVADPARDRAVVLG